MALQTQQRLLRAAMVIAGAAVIFFALDYMIAQPIPNVDVTKAPEYASVIGKRFRTEQELVAIGFTVDRNYKKQVDYVTLVPPPGFSGREVITKERLQQGAVLEVIGVLKADSLLISRIQYVMNRTDIAGTSGAPITVKVSEDSKENFGLNRATYAPVK
jgi:hypothetical protein